MADLVAAGDEPQARTIMTGLVAMVNQIILTRVDAAVEFGAHSVLEAYHEGCETVRAILTVSWACDLCILKISLTSK